MPWKQGGVKTSGNNETNNQAIALMRFNANGFSFENDGQRITFS